MELLNCSQISNYQISKIFGVSIEKRISITNASYNNKTNEWVVFRPSYDIHPKYNLSGDDISWIDEKYILLGILNKIEKPENKTYQISQGYYHMLDKISEEKNLKLLRIHVDDITDMSVIFDKIEYYYIHGRFLNEYTFLMKHEHVDEVKTILSMIGVYNEN